MRSSAPDPFRLTVSSIVRPVWNIPDTTPAREAAGMVMRAPGAVLYVTKGHTMELVGLVRPCDLEKLKGLKDADDARQLATTKDIVAVDQDAKITDVFNIMSGKNRIGKRFDVLPVVNTANELIGMVTRDAVTQIVYGESSGGATASSLSY